MFRRILIATDGSDFSVRAAETAVKLAASLNSALVAVTVEPQFPNYLFSDKIIDEVERSVRRHSQEVLSEVAKTASAVSVACKTRSLGHEAPFRAILDAAASEHCDLIVMGSHGRSGVAAVILGSVTQKVLANANLPVLVVR